MGKKVGVILSGCGVFDGTEIQEAVLTLLFLDRAGAQVVCAAPDIDQLHVLNHMSNEEMNEQRNVLIESARITRGDIVDLKSLKVDHIDALILPGGFGAAKNLSDFALKGPEATVLPELKSILRAVHDAGKPIGALCIAPAAVAKALNDFSPAVTIGDEMGTAAAIETMGASHHQCKVDEIHIDTRNRIVTTPAYMLGPGIKDVAIGIEKLVDQVLALTD
ncbi:MAG: isoprenoid biosynthesis glyoxalase ElbB [Desulfobacteraceae bacterium]|jgi:enhancing lycopene biosynthesis protein 2